MSKVGVQSTSSRADRLGWSLLPSGLFQDQLGEFDLLLVSWEELVARCKWAWMDTVGTEVLHRDTLAGVHKADLQEVQRLMGKFEPSDQALMRAHLDGTLFTTLGRSHFQDDVTDQCPWCEQRDGFHHRVWVCPHFQEARSRVPQPVLDAVPALPSCLACHGWPVILPEMVEVQQAFTMIPEPDMNACAANAKQGDGSLQFFIDGSCLQHAHVALRRSSWAVSQAIGDIGHYEHVLLGAGHVPGVIQTAYRGELWAMLVALEVALRAQSAVTIWCDNASVVKGVRKLLAQTAKGKKFHSHVDLWRRIQAVLAQVPGGRIQVCKVMSHGDLQAAKTEVEHWAFFHNDLVDKAAVTINGMRPPTFDRLWTAAKHAVEARQGVHEAIWTLMVATSQHALETKAFDSAQHPEHPVSEVVPTEAEVAVAEASAAVAADQLPSSWTWPQAVLRRTGDGGLTRMLQWWLAIGLPANQAGGRLARPSCTDAEDI
eukprot:Skav208311  [mRNA]  locus=scaffold897:363615:365759:- [translate_table: standard]